MSDIDQYRNDAEKAGKLLRDGEYELCSFLCGNRIESLLKELIRKSENVKKHLEVQHKKPVEKMTLGEIFLLNSDILYQVFRNRGEVKLIDFNAIRLIRNQVHHVSEKDKTIEVANAHSLYGAYLRFLKAAGEKEETRIENNIVVIQPKEKKPKQILKISTDEQTDDLHAKPILPSQEIPFYKNITSGKYFIFLEDSGDQIRLITPEAKIKLLDPKLFVEIFYEDEHKLLRNDSITKDQLDLYRDLEKKLTRKGIEKPVNEGSKPTSEVFEYKVHNARAKMVITPSGSYRILAGSTAIEEEKGSIPKNIRKMRKEFIGSGIVVVDKVRGLLRFVNNADFDSPSSASSFISGSSTNGWVCFNIPRKNK